MSAVASLSATIDGEHATIAATGTWTAERAGQIEHLIEDATSRCAAARDIAIDLGGIERLDTFGAWLIERLSRAFTLHGASTRLIGLADRDRPLIGEVQLVNRSGAEHAPGCRAIALLAGTARQAGDIARSLVLLAHLLGALALAALGTIAHPRRLRMTSVVHHLERVGWRAVPIVLLSTFLIGAILAQQGIFHFRTFGAEVYVVDMTGILVLREVGVLLVCVMVAGRSASAYAAELGAMKMREEIDALRAMGCDPVELLVLPRIAALVIAVPLLTILGAIAALYGAGLVAWLYGGIAPDVFLGRLREAISVSTFSVGMIKAPFMALVIGLVACVEGLEVAGSAASLGSRTTASVVKSIFLVIVLDGFFAMFFAAIGM